MLRVKGKELRVKYRVKILIFLTFILPCTLSYADPEKTSIAQAEKLFLEGRYEKVIQEADRLIDSGSSRISELYYLKGLSLLKSDRFKEARINFEKIISKFPRSKRTFDSHIGIGDSYFLEGDMRLAIRAYQDILDRYPNDKNISVVYYKLGNCFKNIGSNDKAQECFGKVKELAPLSFEAKMTTDFVSRKIQQNKTNEYFSVQAGSFKNKKNAERLTYKLFKEGFDSFIEMPGNLTGDRLYKVKVGKFGSREEAGALASKLRNLGYATKLCIKDTCQRKEMFSSL